MNNSIEKCGPGNYSLNGFEPCTLCSQGEYQEDYEQKMCIKCPPGTTTGYTGTLDKDHCVDKGSHITMHLHRNIMNNFIIYRTNTTGIHS